MKGKVTIKGAGDIECSLCNPGSNLKDGVSVEIDEVEQHFCWKHLQAMVRMLRNGWMQREHSNNGA